MVSLIGTPIIPDFQLRHHRDCKPNTYRRETLYFLFMYHIRAHRRLRPFLTQSDSASRKWPFSTELFWSYYQSRVNFIVFVLFLEAVGVREYYCCTAVWQSKIGRQLCASRVPRKQRVLRARRTLVQAGWWRWTLAESRQSYVCGVALSLEPPKLHTAGVPVVRKMASIPRTTVVMRYTLLASGARNAPR